VHLETLRVVGIVLDQYLPDGTGDKLLDELGKHQPPPTMHAPAACQELASRR